MNVKKIFNTISLILAIIIILLISLAIYNHIYPISWGIHSRVNQSLLSGEAINGYDPVSYFTENKAVKGNENLTFGYKDAIWYFSSQENLDLFKSDPEKYSPQYGGYCVFAVSKGYSADSDPEAFEIINDKLYLCADPEVKEEWKKEGESGIKNAENNWK